MVLLDTESMTCSAGTISPPGKWRMLNLPPVASLTNLQKISPVPNSASRLRGKLDAMRQFRVGASCANTGAATAALPATAPRPACFRKERRCMLVGSSVATRYGISHAICGGYYTLLYLRCKRGCPAVDHPARPAPLIAIGLDSVGLG